MDKDRLIKIFMFQILKLNVSNPPASIPKLAPHTGFLCKDIPTNVKSIVRRFVTNSQTTYDLIIKWFRRIWLPNEFTELTNAINAKTNRNGSMFDESKRNGDIHGYTINTTQTIKPDQRVEATNAVVVIVFLTISVSAF